MTATSMKLTFLYFHGEKEIKWTRIWKILVRMSKFLPLAGEISMGRKISTIQWPLASIYRLALTTFGPVRFGLVDIWNTFSIKIGTFEKFLRW